MSVCKSPWPGDLVGVNELMKQFFEEIEDVDYSVVQYLEDIGTVYSLKRGNSIKYKPQDWAQHWLSLANSLQSSFRNLSIVDARDSTSRTDAALLHLLSVPFTQSMYEIYKAQSNRPDIRTSITVDKELGYVIVGESSEGQFKSQIFEGISKGLHHFHGAVFTGRLWDTNYAPNGEHIRLDLPQGLYNGAAVTISWKWTTDYSGEKDRPEATLGFIELEAGTPTRFKLSKRQGAGGWEGYDFWGKIDSFTQISAKTTVDGRETGVTFTRLTGT